MLLSVVTDPATPSGISRRSSYTGGYTALYQQSTTTDGDYRVVWSGRHITTCKQTDHEISDDGEDGQRQETHGYEVDEQLGEEIRRHSVEPTGTLVSTTQQYNSNSE